MSIYVLTEWVRVFLLQMKLLSKFQVHFYCCLVGHRLGKYTEISQQSSQSRSQSLVPLDQRSENESSGSNHFEITKEITEFCPFGFTQSVSTAHAWNGCSQSFRSLPQAGRIVGSAGRECQCARSNRPSRRMLLSFATCTCSAQLFNARNNNGTD